MKAEFCTGGTWIAQERGAFSEPRFKEILKELPPKPPLPLRPPLKQKESESK